MTHPISAATISTPTPTARETRPPQITRERRSRPSASVPKRCREAGGSSVAPAPAATACGSWGASQGARKETATKSARRTAPTRRPRWRRRSGVATTRPGIDQEIREVHEEIAGDVDEREDEDSAHDNRQVPLSDCRHQETTQTRPREHRL